MIATDSLADASHTGPETLAIREAPTVRAVATPTPANGGPPEYLGAREKKGDDLPYEASEWCASGPRDKAKPYDPHCGGPASIRQRGLQQAQGQPVGASCPGLWSENLASTAPRHAARARIDILHDCQRQRKDARTDPRVASTR